MAKLPDRAESPPGESARRHLPSVDRVLRDDALQKSPLPHDLLLAATRAVIEEVRAQVAVGRPAPAAEELASLALARAQDRLAPSLRCLVNGTGVILHTNLGRAPVSNEAAAAMADAASQYSNLEFDLDVGERGSRSVHLARLLRDVTGAEDGFAVNNNASAVLLCLTALAAGREVVVSRGQAVEIGGGFRIPDVLRQSGARLVEVGTTNRTYLSDYADVLNPQTAVLLRVHPSNFRVEGFVHSVSLAELVALGEKSGVSVVDDVGSGALLDPAPFGLTGEPLVQSSVQSGAGVVCFSGDKLLGGPQAGILVGKRQVIERLRRHPLARALRIDKVSIAGLEVTLRHYLRREATERVPVWRMIAAPLAGLRVRAENIAAAVGHDVVDSVETRATVGGGSLPGESLPSWSVRIRPPPEADFRVESLMKQMRRRPVPIVGRIEREGLLFDLRTVFPEQDDLLRAALTDLLG